jgi:hypothetical protein
LRTLFGAENVDEFQVRHRSGVKFVAFMSFYYCDRRILQNESNFVLIMTAVNERNQIQPFVASFIPRLRVLFLSRLLSIRVMGTCQRTECTEHNQNRFSKCPPSA